MNDSAAFIKKQAKFMGHGEQHDDTINNNISAGVPSFSSKGHHEYYDGNRKVDTVLNIKQGNRNEMYFWNSYDATLTNPQGQETKQRFYIETFRKEDEQGNKSVRTYGFTTKEACNLLDRDHEGNSRSVNKEFLNKQSEPYTAWYKLDLDAPLDKHNNHPIVRYPDFDIKAKIAKHGILENLEDVVKSVKKGNLQAVTVESNGEKVRQHFAADPEKQDVLIYDKHMRLIYRNGQDIQVQVVDVIPGQKVSPVQEQSDLGQSAALPTNGNSKQTAEMAPAANKEKEVVFSKKSTSPSQDEKRNELSKDKEEPLLTKGKGKKASKKVTEEAEAPSKIGPKRGKGGDDLLQKNRTSSKSKGVGY